MLESLRPDPTFYPSPRIAREAPAETLAYTVLLSPDRSKPDALAVVDVDRRLGQLRQGGLYGSTCPTAATSSIISAGTPAPRPCRRSRAIPSSSAAISSFPASARRASTSSTPSPIRTQADDRQDHRAGGGLRARPAIRVRTPSIADRKGSMSARSAAPARTAPTGPRRLHHGLRDLRHPRALGDRPRPAGLHYDFWWNLPRNYMVTSEWGLPPQFENGVVRRGSALQQIRPRGAFLGPARPARTCRRSTSAPITRWRSRSAPRTIPSRNTASSASSSTRPISRGRSGHGGAKAAKFSIAKTATIPAEPADKDACCPICSKASAPCRRSSPTSTCRSTTVSFMSSCWGTGELRQYDVSDPMNPRLAGSVRSAGSRGTPPIPNGKPFGGGPQMVEISRDGKRVYFTNSLYSAWDEQFYPGGVPGREGHGQRRPDWRHCARPEVLRRVRRGLRRAPDPASRAATARRIPSAIRRPERSTCDGRLTPGDRSCGSLWSRSAPITGSIPGWAGRSRSPTACGRRAEARSSPHCFRSPAGTSSRWRRLFCLSRLPGLRRLEPARSDGGGRPCRGVRRL